MTAYTTIVRNPDPWVDTERARRLRCAPVNRAFLDEFDAIRRRTNALVNRLCPAFPQPNVSSRYPELNGSMDRWLAWEARCAERSRLFKMIEPRIAEKVRRKSGRG